MARLICPDCNREVPKGLTYCPWCSAGPPSSPSQSADSNARARLTVIGGNLDGMTEFDIGRDGITIGRFPGNSVLLPAWDDFASRHHARIVAEGGRFYVEDTGSTNGTLVNGRRVAMEELHSGDEIALSATRFQFSGLESDTVSFEPEGDGQLPATIGPYRVHGKCRDGSMALVYLAVGSAGEHVALKVPRPEFLGDPIFRRRFANEMEDGIALSRAGRHPNIVYVYGCSGKSELGLADTIVMEYVGGGSLRSRVPDGPTMDTALAGSIIKQCCSGLGYAHHELGIVHRDVKPENILMDDLGVPKLADFGIAHHMSRKTVVTDQVLGTPYYMSPEQARGESNLDARSDIYSLAAVWYELLTGQPPFIGEFWSVLRQLKDEIPKTPSRFRSDIPRRQEEVLMRGLEKSPDRRPSSVLEMAECLNTT